MRVLLAALNCPKGDLAGNLAAHRALLGEARARGCDIAVFPEMSLTGSVDPATRPERLIALDDPPVRDLAAATRDTVPALFGVAERGPHITQVYAAGGEVVGAYRKRHLGEGEEAYTPGGGPALFEVGGVAFGVAPPSPSPILD